MERFGEEEAKGTSWYLDSGCSIHMTGRRDWFMKMEVAHGKIKSADDRTL